MFDHHLRRPSGQPIEEEEEPEPPTRADSAEPPREDRDATRWTYSALEEDENVWGR